VNERDGALDICARSSRTQRACICACGTALRILIARRWRGAPRRRRHRASCDAGCATWYQARRRVNGHHAFCGARAHASGRRAGAAAHLCWRRRHAPLAPKSCASRISDVSNITHITRVVRARHETMRDIRGDIMLRGSIFLVAAHASSLRGARHQLPHCASRAGVISTS